jgi:hypothetical protein
MTKQKNYFETLSQVNVKNKIEKKNGASYLSWAWAWDELLKEYPSATYEIIRYENNLPYVYDEATGYMVATKMTIEGITREMWLPVMNGANKAMKKVTYKYKTRNGDKEVEAATMFDINKTIMRCLVKNIAMFGLGLYIFAGEDLPEALPEELPVEKINKEQLATIEKLIKEADMETDFFIQIMKIEEIKDLPKSKFEGVIEKLNKRIELNKPKENEDNK